VFETGVRQFRLAMSMVWGRPISPRNVEHLVEDALRTLQEFGAPGDDVEQLLDGPFTDPVARTEFQNRAIQLTARRLARRSPYYQEVFASSGIEPEKLTVDTMPRVPVTVKRHLQERQRDFICTDSHPDIATRTTGTTGQPTEIWLSRYEIELWPALAALSGLLRDEIAPRDCLQINISSRATAAVQMNIKVAQLAHARTRMLGVIPAEESLDSLLDSGEGAPTQVNTYPSYLALLVLAARRRNLGPHDFHLRRVITGGEVLSSALARAARETFGGAVIDTFAMTEILPLGGRVCSYGHMHMDLNMGHVEVIDLETGEPAEPGALGTLVVTPYYPYRECMPLFRYDTRDLVRCLPDEQLTCELAGTPAISRILGKADHLLRAGGRVVTMRDLVEVYGALPSQPWPARFSARVVGDEIELVVPEEALDGMTKEEVERRFRAAGIPLHLADTVAREPEVRRLRPLRADLLETTFAGRK
jgi:phenylacetate-CoA ligase